MDIVFSREAEQDLIELFDFILQDNPRAAEKLLGLIQDEILHLAEHPHLGRPGRVPKTRELVLDCGPFIVPYQVKRQSLQILRIYHTARKWPETF